VKNLDAFNNRREIDISSEEYTWNRFINRHKLKVKYLSKWLLKLSFLASLARNFSTICSHMRSKFVAKSAKNHQFSQPKRVLKEV
jgi:hypothetical protein